MGDVVKSTENHNGQYGDFGSFNRIKRSRFVRSDDAVESAERHRDDKHGAAEFQHEEYIDEEDTVPVLTGWQGDMMHHA